MATKQLLMNKRSSGILLHVTSLPSPYGIGDLGPWAYKFADFLAETKQGFWQVLALNPTSQLYGNSPYAISSAFAGNTNLISPDLLVKEGLLCKGDIEKGHLFPEGYCDYRRAISYKERIFVRAYRNFTTNKEIKSIYERFCLENSEWLDDFALFMSIKKHLKGKVWNLWKKGLKDRSKKELAKVSRDNKDDIEKTKFLQFVFFKQWFLLKDYCNKKGIRIIGDMPIYVNYDSADVWAHSAIFNLDKDKGLITMAGVPPDYFSRRGQLWGNPVYRWDVLKENGFMWWVRRIEHSLSYLDILRIDHFRGLVSYWEVPCGEKTAVNGRWGKVPTGDFFDTLGLHFRDFPFIAEDLGMITDDVREVLHYYGLPGMKVLLFAFKDDNPLHPYLPHTYDRNCVVYTGTHDNNTVKGWFKNEALPEEKNRLFRYIGRKLRVNEVNWEFIRLAMMSRAGISILPLQDILGLGEEARMNKPDSLRGNWQWRFSVRQLTASIFRKLLNMTELYERGNKTK